ncbi:MAG: bifunctional diaminohydroxyphosphoribosylaminopyrimidine deaminase/5-amino-6-(5-phosphoribosylamino)uracil reductase RibD [Muribaculaceae bacterium]|nr:bifunctional diaminohydroxyphosphoribosylaminopyrimidine deaminase/5-amino-6-(5-phosphoribosylamino)uracil reductase RibD [Muribaculaceae bacterium]
MVVDEKYMRRALELARHGMGQVSPNPMVGAVIVAPDGSIIGEGYHRRYGEGHAEVNAVASVAQRSLLPDSTMYVTLEPCSHYGKTPPCAKLIIDCHIPRVVVGAEDPNEKVCGRGIAMLREAGVEVVTGVLAEESRRLNAVFITAHSFHRPFVTLKWAQSADGYLDVDRSDDIPAAAISSPLGRLAVHRLRAVHDAILVGSGTVISDNPILDSRLWGGRSPRPVVLDRRGRISDNYRVLDRDPIIIDCHEGVADILAQLYCKGISSVLVEGGAQVLRSFIDAGLWDFARVETSSVSFATNGRVSAPVITVPPMRAYPLDSSMITLYSNNPLIV